MSPSFLVRRGADVGAAVAEARRSAQLTQEQLAERLGLDRTYLARLEAGASVQMLDRALRALRALGAEVVVTFPSRSDDRPGGDRPGDHQ